MDWNRIFRKAIAATAVALCASVQAAPGDVTVSISAQRHSVARSDDVAITVTLANTASSARYVLKWHTPFGDIEEPLFEVRRDGVKVPYLGARYKRAAPGPADYYLLAPGASFSARVELSALYDLSVTGDYTIGYDTSSPRLFDGGQQAERAGAMRSQPLTLFIEGRPPRGAAAQEAQALEAQRAQQAPGSLAFGKCTAQQQGAVTAAAAAGQAMAADADSYLNSGTQDGSRYSAWFGAGEPARAATVKAHFAAIKDAFANKPLAVDCGCKKPYYAYVYPARPYLIYVCKAFWSAPLTGTDSKGGTLVHEMSHFNVVAATDDWVYGQEGAAELALTDPVKAVDNADSHEYFGENTPALP